MTIANVSFPGPRPLVAGEALVGREAHLSRIYDACGALDVITLTAWSGVGKTSFLQAGLMPMLRDAGYYAVLPDPSDGETRGWSQVLRVVEPDLVAGMSLTQVAERAYRTLVGLPLDSANALLDDLLERLAGLRAAVVVDQFEELLRSHGPLADALLRLIAQLAPQVGVHIVVARSEYRERLRPIEEALAISVRPMTLQEIPAAALPAIFEAPFTQAGVSVAPEVTKRIVAWWEAARAEGVSARFRQVGSEGLATIGLLHFQAMARAFVEWVKQEWDGELAGIADRDPALLSASLLDAYVATRVVERAPRLAAAARGRGEDPTAFVAPSRDGGSWLFDDALVSYVQEHADALLREPLPRPDDEDRIVGTDGPLWWAQGPALMAARVAPAFIVAGFKQPQALYSLLSYALEEELSTGQAGWLGERIQETPARRNALLEQAAGRLSPAGVALRDGHSPTEVIVETIDCLHASLRYLGRPDVNILRVLEHDGEPVFELVHDGMGGALKAWAGSYLAEPLAVLATIGGQTSAYVEGLTIAPSMVHDAGHDLAVWGAAANVPSPFEAGREHLVLEGLSFPSAAFFGCTFRDVTLRRADFSGASFINCRFENVVFEDCDLRALIFLGRGDRPGQSELERVTFRNTDDDTERLDLLTIKRPAIADGVAFEGIALVTGLFLQSLPAGAWRLADSRVRHLAITPALGSEGDPPRFTVDGGVVGELISWEGRVLFTDDDTDLSRTRLEPARPAGD